MPKGNALPVPKVYTALDFLLNYSFPLEIEVYPKVV